MKPCNVVNYRYRKNSFNFGVDPAQNGQLAAVLDFCCNMLYRCLAFCCL